MTTGTARVEPDPDNPGELLIVFPEGFLEDAGFEVGDTVVWEEFGSAFILRKQ